MLLLFHVTLTLLSYQLHILDKLTVRVCIVYILYTRPRVYIFYSQGCYWIFFFFYQFIRDPYFENTDV